MNGWYVIGGVIAVVWGAWYVWYLASFVIEQRRLPPEEREQPPPLRDALIGAVLMSIVLAYSRDPERFRAVIASWF